MSDIDRALGAIPCPADRNDCWPIIGTALGQGLSEDGVLACCENGPNFDLSAAISTIRSQARQPDNGQRGAQRLISLYLICATWRRRLQLHDERAAWPKWGATP